MLVFPTEEGRASDFEANGMIDAVAELLDEGRVKLYCVDSYDAATWSDRSIPLEERARRHGGVRVVDPRPGRRRGSTTTAAARWRSLTLGASIGAFHAANFALRRADLFPLALGLSGNYDPSTWHGWGEQGDALYFQNPTAYVANLDGDHLDWLRRHVHLALVCGQGMWEDTTGAQTSTRTLAGPARARRTSRTSWTCGATTSPTTGRGGAASSPTTYPGSAEGDDRGPAPGRAAAGHRGGLARARSRR